MRVLAVILLTPILAGVVLVASRQSVNSKPPPVRTKPQALVWADRVFTEPGPFSHWLRSRDRSYAAWARKHQKAALILNQ